MFTGSALLLILCNKSAVFCFQQLVCLHCLDCNKIFVGLSMSMPNLRLLNKHLETPCLIFSPINSHKISISCMRCQSVFSLDFAFCITKICHKILLFVTRLSYIFNRILSQIMDHHKQRCVLCCMKMIKRLSCYAYESI